MAFVVKNKTQRAKPASKSRRQWPAETTAIWLAVKPFISQTDGCRRMKLKGEKRYVPFNRHQHVAFQQLQTDVKWDNGIVPCDPNDPEAGNVVLESIGYADIDIHRQWANKPLEEIRDSYIVYYRSNLWADAVTGYGRSMKDMLRLPAEVRECLNINGPKRVTPNVGWLLLAIDIDYHTGKPSENDSHVVLRWIKRYFPGVYFERSHSGSGWHLYLKLYYHFVNEEDRRQQVEEVTEAFQRFLRVREHQRSNRTLATLDTHAFGVPSGFGNDSKWSEEIKTTYGLYLPSKSYCVNIPLFREGLNDIRIFQESPFFNINVFMKNVELKISPIEKSKATGGDTNTTVTPLGYSPDQEDESLIDVVRGIRGKTTKDRLDVIRTLQNPKRQREYYALLNRVYRRVLTGCPGSCWRSRGERSAGCVYPQQRWCRVTARRRPSPIHVALGQTQEGEDGRIGIGA